jgi:hypothetical protein
MKHKHRFTQASGKLPTRMQAFGTVNGSMWDAPLTTSCGQYSMSGVAVLFSEDKVAIFVPRPATSLTETNSQSPLAKRQGCTKQGMISSFFLGID